jgi:hypothetical protein
MSYVKVFPGQYFIEIAIWNSVCWTLTYVKVSGGHFELEDTIKWKEIWTQSEVKQISLWDILANLLSKFYLLFYKVPGTRHNSGDPEG